MRRRPKTTGYVRKRVKNHTKTLKIRCAWEVSVNTQSMYKSYKKIAKHIWGIRKGIGWVFRGGFAQNNNSYTQFRTQKHLKRAKHVHVHVIQHPTKFQTKIKKKYDGNLES